MKTSRIIAAAVALTLVGGTYISKAPRLINAEITACAADESSAFVLGDVDSNGLIDARDASAVLTEYAKLSTEKSGSFSSEEVKAADVDKNGLVDARDATNILSYYAYSSTTATNECKSLEDFLNKGDNSDKTSASPQDNTPNIPDIKVSYIVQDGTKVSVQFDSTLNSDEYFTGMTVFRKESEEIGYVLYSDINFDNETPDFSYVYDFWDNGEYRVTLYSIGHPEWYSDFTIDSIGAGVVTEDKFVDDKDPVITLDVPDTTGLRNGDEFKFKVYTDEPCTITIGMDTYADTSEVEYTAYFNSDFNIVATDSWANSSVATVSVRAFEDGKLPSGNSLDKNENPLNKDNKDTFYKDVADGRFKNVDRGKY